MSDKAIPAESEPLSPFGYWQESLSVWVDFSKQTSELLMGQFEKLQSDEPAKADTSTPVESFAAEYMRFVADVNLRHWQNTARLLEGLPSWMQSPKNLVGSAMVDWFDRMRRGEVMFDLEPFASASATPEPKAGYDEDLPCQPQSLPAPDGKADDLTKIKGIGPKLSSTLNEIGIYHYRQIAGWSDAEAAWVDDYLSFKGRVSRENWIEQARAFSTNGAVTLH